MSIQDDRIAELLADNIRLENERRGWKARCGVAQVFLRALLIDIPLMERLGGGDAEEYMGDLRKAYERADRLERDAWCGAADVAKRYMSAVTSLDETAIGDRHALLSFICRWETEFKAALGD